MTEFDKRILDQGGDPRCFHCRLVVLVGDQLEALGEGRPCGARMVGALAQLAGELIANAPPEQRKPLLARAIQILRGSAGYPVVDETDADDAGDELATVEAVPGKQLH